LKILHDFKNIKEGSSHIFTLADTYITDKESEMFDSLINPDVQEKEKYLKYDDIKKGKKYNKYDEEKRELLPQYTEDVPQQSFMLDESGRAVISEEDKQRLINERLEKAKKIFAPDFGSTELKAAPEFFNKDEMVSFSRPKKEKRKKKKQKSSKLIQELQESTPTAMDTSEDFGTREDRAKKQKDVQFKEVLDILDKRKKI